MRIFPIVAMSLLSTITPANAQTDSCSADDLIESLSAHRVGFDSFNQAKRRQNALLALLDTSSGNAPFIKKIAKQHLFSTQGCPKDALKYKPYLRDIEIRIKKTEGFRELQKAASEILLEGKTIVVVIVIDKNGIAKEVLVKENSGQSVLDKMFTDHLKLAYTGMGGLLPLKKLPPSIEDNACIVTEFYCENGNLEFAMLPFGRVGGAVDPTLGIVR